MATLLGHSINEGRILLPHELCVADQILLPHQLCKSVSDGAIKRSRHLETLMAPHELLHRSYCSGDRTVVEEIMLPHQMSREIGRSNIQEKIVLPDESIKNKKDVSVKIRGSDSSAISIKIEMPYETLGRCCGCSDVLKDIVLSVDVAGTAFELSVSGKKD